MQNQIDVFVASLQSIATEYSDPAIILQHIPVLNDHLDKIQPLIDHKEYALAGLIALFVARRILKKRKKAVKPTSMVMPPPYTGAALEEPGVAKEADTPLRTKSTSLDTLANMVSPRKAPSAAQTAPVKRSTEQQLADVSAVSFTLRPALTPDEARLRVIVDAAVKSLGAPLMVMARTSVSALLDPGREAVGQERAHALAAIDGKTLDFGLFDRAGRLIVALELPHDHVVTPSAQANRAVVTSCLAQAGIPCVSLHLGDAPAALADRIAPYCGARHPAAAQPRTTARPDRPARPTRPGRPARPASAIAAE